MKKPSKTISRVAMVKFLRQEAELHRQERDRAIARDCSIYAAAESGVWAECNDVIADMLEEGPVP